MVDMKTVSIAENAMQYDQEMIMHHI